jgi:hypothetical protein
MSNTAPVSSRLASQQSYATMCATSSAAPRRFMRLSLIIARDLPASIDAMAIAWKGLPD